MVEPANHPDISLHNATQPSNFSKDGNHVAGGVWLNMTCASDKSTTAHRSVGTPPSIRAEWEGFEKFQHCGEIFANMSANAAAVPAACFARTCHSVHPCTPRHLATQRNATLELFQGWQSCGRRRLAEHDMRK